LSKDGDDELAEAYREMLSLVDEESRIVANTILKIVQEIDSKVEINIEMSSRIEMLLLEEREKLDSS
jgi:plasmid maintenance system antidote protein VapI